MERALNILVVDDEQIVLDSVRKHLRRENYSVITVLTAEEALLAIADKSIDLILTDLMMPEMDGLELMAVVREKHPNLPVIMVTGYATINTALQANQLGAFDYVAKPFTKVELLSVVKRAADLINATESSVQKIKAESLETQTIRDTASGKFKVIGENTWIMREEDGHVRIGSERPFLVSFGRIQTVYLPSLGDTIRQGSVCFQVFSSDLRTQSLLSPLSGTVVKVNENVLKDPSTALQDPYGKGWLLCIEPSKFEDEVKILGR